MTNFIKVSCWLLSWWAVRFIITAITGLIVTNDGFLIRICSFSVHMTKTAIGHSFEIVFHSIHVKYNYAVE